MCQRHGIHKATEVRRSRAAARISGRIAAVVIVRHRLAAPGHAKARRVDLRRDKRKSIPRQAST